MCVCITQNKLSEWSVNNETVNMNARPLPTNHSLCRGSEANNHSHIYLQGEGGNSGFHRQSICVSLPSQFYTLPLFFPPVSSKKHADV